MAAYRADIEIGVKGIQQLQAITKQINTLSVGVDGVNKRLAGASQSVNAYNANLAKAAATLNKVNAGTVAEATAVRQYVQALGQANAARDRQNKLIQQQIALQRKAVPTANAGFGVQGPALPPTAGVGGGTRGGRGIGGRLGGAISGSIIGGAFPLLFGQGGGAAAGGAIGGLVGGLAGPGGSFAGSLLGTLLGDIASRGQAVKQLAEDIGFSAQQTKQLSDAFKVANTDVEKFTAVIQNIRGVGLEIEDQAKAIQLVTRLTELYGGSFEKTGNAITSVLESGKVTQANLNQLTSQGINIQQALADKYNVNRDAILKMAKDGEISVQDLVDTLVDLGNKTDGVAQKQQNVFEAAYQQIASAAGEAANTAINSFTTTGGTLQQIAADIQSAFTAMFRELIRGTSEFILGLGEIARIAGSALDGVAAKFIEIQYGIIGAAKNLPVLDSGIIEFAKNALAVLNPVGTLIDKIRGAGRNRPQQFGPEPPPVSRTQIEGFRVPSQAAAGGAAAKGPKPPEDRTASLLADLQAITEIGNAENLIRDLLYEGRDLLAAEVELTKALSDIERDRVKQLEQANYQSEKDVINKTASVRAAQAEQAVADKIREINTRRFEEELRNKEIVRNTVKVFTDIRKEQELQAQYGKTYLRLVREGMLPAEAERIANFEKLVTQQLLAVEEQIKLTELAILEAKARGLSTSELEKQLKIYKEQQDAIKTEAEKGPGEGAKPGDRIKEAVAAARGELNELLDLENQVIAAAAAIGDAFQQAFKGLVSGAMTGQEALAAFFKGVGEHFLDMASKMIAKLIEIYILETVLGFISGAAGAGGGAPRGTPGAVAPNGLPYFGPAFAEGGFVTGPTRALIGEGGEPEYVIPASKMRTAMGRYSAGARGSSVVSGSGGPISSENGGGVATMEPIDVRYSIERINNVDYVTADQFQRGLAQAAQQGAIQGERRAMRSLKNSAATRRGVGI